MKYERYVILSFEVRLEKISDGVIYDVLLISWILGLLRSAAAKRAF